jgi:GLPGLI family protein
MKKYFTIFCTLMYLANVNAQNFTSDYGCLYNLDYKRKDNSKGEEQFILEINSKDGKSVFLSYPTYKLSKAKNKDFNTLMANQTEFSEVVVCDKNTYQVFEEIVDYKYHYTEPNTIKWEISKDRKKIGKYKCKLAICYAYGRKWNAWFTSEIALNYGPYKFGGLPGLIVALNDDENRFSFILQDIGKRPLKLTLPVKKEYKIATKNNFYKIRFKIKTDGEGSPIFEDAKDKKEWFAGIFKVERNHPFLDIEFPKE